MKNESAYEFTVTTRYASCSTNIARCNGFTASSTNSCKVAAEKAAQKAFDAMCRSLCMEANNYVRNSSELMRGAYLVTFTKKNQ